MTVPLCDIVFTYVIIYLCLYSLEEIGMRKGVKIVVYHHGRASYH